MKRWAWLLAVPVLISLAGAQVTSSLNSQTSPPQTTSSQGTWHDAASSDRMFFPKDMLWGWVQVDIAPPHNEVDPNQCAGNAGQYGGVNAPCSLFARYIIGGILEVRPFGRGPLRRSHGLRSAHISVRQDHPQDALHLVARRDWSRTLLGSRHLHEQGIRIPCDPALPLRPSGRARHLPRAGRSRDQRPLGPLRDVGRPQDLRHAPLVVSSFAFGSVLLLGQRFHSASAFIQPVLSFGSALSFGQRFHSASASVWRSAFGWRSAFSAAIRVSSSLRALAPEVPNLHAATGIAGRINRRTSQKINAKKAPNITNGSPNIRNSQPVPLKLVTSPLTVAVASRCSRPPNTVMSPATFTPLSRRTSPPNEVVSPAICPSSSTTMLPPKVVTSPAMCPRTRTLQAKHVTSATSSPGAMLMVWPNCVRS